MRLYRARRLDNGIWVEGDYSLYQQYNGGLIYARISFIDPNNKKQLISYVIDPTTVGQYIGLRDQRRTQEFPAGLRIYKGDVVNRGCFYEGKPDELSVVVWDQPMARWRWEGIGHIKGRGLYPNTSVSRHAKVIGNIHENPELLEQG